MIYMHVICFIIFNFFGFDYTLFSTQHSSDNMAKQKEICQQVDNLCAPKIFSAKRQICIVYLKEQSLLDTKGLKKSENIELRQKESCLNDIQSFVTALFNVKQGLKIKINPEDIKIIDACQSLSRVKKELIYSSEVKFYSIVEINSNFLSECLPGVDIIFSDEQKKLIEQNVDQEIVFGLQLTKNSRVIRFNISTVHTVRLLHTEKKNIETNNQDKAEPIIQQNKEIILSLEMQILARNIATFLKKYGHWFQLMCSLSVDTIEVIDSSDNPDELKVTLWCSPTVSAPWFLWFALCGDIGEVRLLFNNDEQKKNILEKINRGESFGLKLTKDGAALEFKVDTIEFSKEEAAIVHHLTPEPSKKLLKTVEFKARQVSEEKRKVVNAINPYNSEVIRKKKEMLSLSQRYKFFVMGAGICCALCAVIVGIMHKYNFHSVF